MTTLVIKTEDFLRACPADAAKSFSRKYPAYMTPETARKLLEMSRRRRRETIIRRLLAVKLEKEFYRLLDTPGEQTLNLNRVYGKFGQSYLANY